MAADVSCLEPHVSIIHPTGPILCADNEQRQYFVDKLFIQPIVHIHTKKNQSVHRGVLRKEIKLNQLNNNNQVYYFVYTAQQEGLNKEEGVHVTFEDKNARKIYCTNIAKVGETTCQLELDNNNCETINDFISAAHGNAISSNIPIDVIYDSTSTNKNKQEKKKQDRKKRDPMSKDDQFVITSNFKYLVETIEVQHVKTLLFEKFILDRKDIDRIKKASNGGREDETEELLQIVMYGSGSDVFPKFVKCLNDVGYEDIASTLQPSLYSTI